MLEKLRIQRFCCCCTTRTGSLVIGVFGWIGSLMHSIALSTPTQTTKLSQTEEGELVLKEESSSNVGPILLSIFMVAISAAMVYGIYQNNRRYILPWLVIKGLECSILTIATIILFFMLFVSEEVGFVFLIFFLISAFTGSFWYFFICVWSLYMDMGEQMSTITPIGQSIPMTEPNNQYQMNEPIKSPPQEMV